MEAYLTCGINAKSPYFDFLIEIEKINIKDLIVENRDINPNIKLNKFQVLAEVFNNAHGDLLIGNAIKSIEDLLNLKRELGVHFNKIRKFFLKENDSYSAYKTFYSDHSRWLDYSPEFVKLKQEEHNLELRKLAKQLEQEGIEVIVIDSV